MQALIAWFSHIDAYLLRLGFMKMKLIQISISVVQNELVILLLYADDLLLKSVENLIPQTKRDLVVEFDIKDLGLMHYYLGLEAQWKYG